MENAEPFKSAAKIEPYAHLLNHPDIDMSDYFVDTDYLEDACKEDSESIAVAAIDQMRVSLNIYSVDLHQKMIHRHGLVQEIRNNLGKISVLKIEIATRTEFAVARKLFSDDELFKGDPFGRRELELLKKQKNKLNSVVEVDILRLRELDGEIDDLRTAINNLVEELFKQNRSLGQIE